MAHQDVTPAVAAGPRFSPGYRRWLLLLLMLIYTSDFIDRSIFSTLAQPIKLGLHLTDTQLGVLGGLAFAVVYTVLGLVIARLAERFHRVGIMSACVAVWSAMTALSGVAMNFGQLLVARMGVAVGEAGAVPCAHSLIADHFPVSRRATALAVFSLGIPLGVLIGAVAGGWIAQNVSWRAAFMLVGAPGLMLAVLGPLTLKEPPRGHVDGLDASGPAPSTFRVIARIWERRTVVWVLAGATLAATAGYGVQAFIAAYFVRRFGFDYAQAGLATGAIAGIGAGISTLAGGLLTDLIGRWDRRSYGWVPAVGLVAATPMFIWGFAQSDWKLALPLLFVAGVAQQLYLAPTFAVANIAVEPRMRATSIALLSAVWSLIGLGFGPVIVGAISDRTAAALSHAAGADVMRLCGAAGCAGAKEASSVGLIYGLMAISVLFAAGAAFYLIATRNMRKDLPAA